MLKLLIPIMILMLPLALVFGALQFLKWNRSRKRQRPPFEHRLLRSPGQSLGKEIQEISEDITANLFMIFIYPLILYCIYLRLFGSSGNAGWITITHWTVGIVLTVFFLGKSIVLMNRRRALRIGMAGEMATGEELNRLMLDGYHVYHDFPAERFNIDHIVVGPSGVFAAETKARSKGSRKKPTDEAKVIYDGVRLRFPTWTTTKPLEQGKAQAVWLSKWLSGAVGDPVRVSPMLTIPGWYIERKSPNGIPVLNPKQVKGYLDGKKESVLAETMIKRICHQLEQKCRDVDLWDWY